LSTYFISQNKLQVFTQTKRYRRENLLDIMEQLNKKGKITFIFSMHDQRVEKENKARRVITLEDGKIVSDIKK